MQRGRPLIRFPRKLRPNDEARRQGQSDSAASDLFPGLISPNDTPLPPDESNPGGPPQQLGPRDDMFIRRIAIAVANHIMRRREQDQDSEEQQNRARYS